MDSPSPRIHTIDLHYLGVPQAIACFLIDAPDGLVLIETGPASTREALVEGLARLGRSPREIRHALLTHIHLDHAGAAGWLAQQGALIHVHEFGAAHLADPSRLLASARRIYGDRMERLWGHTLPVPEHSLRPVRDGEVIDIGGAALRAIETPGHARHHHAFALEADDRRICFTGDAAGMIVPGVPGERYISLPTPPPEFDLEAWLSTADRIENERFDSLMLTHFGEVAAPGPHLAGLRRDLGDHAAFVRQRLDDGMAEAAIRAEYAGWVQHRAAAAGVAREQMARYATDHLLAMNVTGLVRYWRQGGS